MEDLKQIKRHTIIEGVVVGLICLIAATAIFSIVTRGYCPDIERGLDRETCEAIRPFHEISNEMEKIKESLK